MQRFGQAQKTIPRPNRAQQADRLTNSVRIAVSGDGSSDSVLFDGSANVDLNFTLSDTGVVAGAYDYVSLTVDSKGRIMAISSNPTPVTGDNIASLGYWSPLTNGDPINPELIFDADGNTIDVWVET